MKKIILLIGIPGAGKGSIGKEFEKYGYTHISSSRLLKQAGYDLTSSRNIPDEVTLSLIKEEIDKSKDVTSIILEGYPRNLKQLECLEREIEITKTIYLKVPVSVALKRVTDRIICPSCEAIYTTNLYKPPKHNQICDFCGNTLKKREGDDKKIFQKRMGYFIKNSYPIIRYYDSCNKLIVVDATQNINEIISLIKAL